MSLEAADKAIFVQQVKHHRMSGLMLISSILFTWVLWRTLVDLRWMPNGIHMAKSGVSNVTLIVTMSVQCGYLTRS